MPRRVVSVKASGIRIRALEAVEEMKLGVELQKRVWGYSEIDTIPDQVFVVAKESGGQVLMAFDGGAAVGFALAFVGFRHGHAHLHSHMVGVVPEYQNRGVGRTLKLAQRDDAIARGIDLIEWTFDPLQLKNAFFNLVKLGTIVRRYIPNCYGLTTSHLHAGLRTDRLVAEWWLKSNRVRGALAGKPLTPPENAMRLSIPATIGALRSSDPAEAVKIQANFRRQAQKHFADGNAAVGFELDEARGSYVLEPYED